MTTQALTYLPDIRHVRKAYERLRNVVVPTALTELPNWGQALGANIWAKREDLQIVRSYKIRGSYNKIAGLTQEEKSKGIVCASAGNHAQGVAFSCAKLGIKGTIYMPTTTPQQKIKAVERHGGAFIDLILTGDTFDTAYHVALQFSKEQGAAFIHPFDDEQIIEGQGTVAFEILEQLKEPIDYVIMPIGGGGLASGVSAVFSSLSPHTKLIGVEPLGAPSMKRSIEAGHVVTLEQIDTFTDGAAVKRVGNKTFAVCQKLLTDVLLVPEGKICDTIMRLYNENAIVAEPAGALALAAVDMLADKLHGKNVVVVISGGNNDIARFPEIRERAVLYKKLKHYFIIRFPQRPGALKEFVNDVLGPTDDIVHFEYTKKTSSEQGPALVGIEIKSPDDLAPLMQRMKQRNFLGEYVNEKPDLMRYVV